MSKVILVTGSTDGIGLETAKMLVSLGHHVILHGRNPKKLEEAVKAQSDIPGGGGVEGYVADLSHMSEVQGLAKAVGSKYDILDVLINNAGVYSSREPVTHDDLDVRFAVNTIAPYLLTKLLIPLLGKSGRVINMSSAAQSPVNPEALTGKFSLPDGAAYAQSKLALTMWSRAMALSLRDQGPAIITVNPGSMIGTKMVREAYGSAGRDIQIGAEILTRAALSDEFATASGQYFDNDWGRFSEPHQDALDPDKCEALVGFIENVLADKTE